MLFFPLKRRSLGIFCLIFVIMVAWVFSGWPQIWQNPPVPPEAEKVKAGTETQRPDVLLEQVELTGVVGDIDDDPDSPEGDWLTAPVNVSTVVRVSFPTPTDNPTVGADKQEFRIRLRKTATNNGKTDDAYTVHLYENGEKKQDTIAQGVNVPTDPGVVISASWDATNLGTADGSLVEYYIITTPEASGAPTSRGSIEVGAIEWNVDYTSVGTLTVDIVDAAGDPVASPSMAMGVVTLSFAYQTANGTFGVSTEKIRVDNSTANPEWTLTIAADAGSTAFWDGVASDYDFNDPTAEAGDGADADGLGGQMTIDASGGTITPEGECSNTGLTLGSSASFSEGATDSITLFTAGATTETSCYWDLTGVSVSQTIPAEQPAESFSINMTLTVTAL